MDRSCGLDGSISIGSGATGSPLIDLMQSKVQISSGWISTGTGPSDADQQTITNGWGNPVIQASEERSLSCNDRKASRKTTCSRIMLGCLNNSSCRSGTTPHSRTNTLLMNAKRWWSIAMECRSSGESVISEMVCSSEGITLHHLANQ